MDSETQISDRYLGDVLILEDEPLLSAEVEDVLFEMGAARVHVCGSPGDALQVLDAHGLNLAILDVIVGNDDSFRVADALAQRGIPYFFASATSSDGIDERHRHRPLLGKPFSNAELMAFIVGAAQAREPV